jgi:hypothetical protein
MLQKTKKTHSQTVQSFWGFAEIDLLRVKKPVKAWKYE